jgi:phosphatidylserine/phosphatidylglycerophosphate/cardiolipin synthase-like enzyme
LIKEYFMPENAATFETRGLVVHFQSERAGVNADLTDQLAKFISATEGSLDCAIYDLRHPTIAAALARVKQDGKTVRIAYDGGKVRSGGLAADPKPNGTAQLLEEVGLIDVATAVHEGRQLMHDKFLVRDGRTVWTGSANFTKGGLELQDNNCLAITSPELARRYTAVFEDLISGTHHHRRGRGRSVASALATGIADGGAEITPFFSPLSAEGVEEIVVAELQGARRVRVLAFLISDPGILGALAALGNDPNVDIRGVYDPHGMQDVLRFTHQDPASFWFMQDSRFVAAPSHAFHPGGEQDFMHNKVMVINDRIVVTGSYNFSENAEANDENLLVIDSGDVARAYTAYFDRLFAAYTRPPSG